MLRLVFAQYNIYRVKFQKKDNHENVQIRTYAFSVRGILQTTNFSSVTFIITIAFYKIQKAFTVHIGFKEFLEKTGSRIQENYLRFTWSSVEVKVCVPRLKCVVPTQRANIIPDSIPRPIDDSDTLICTLCFTQILAIFLGPVPKACGKVV